MSKFVFDSMLPKYPQFQPFISSHHLSTNQNNSTSVVTATGTGVGSTVSASSSSLSHNNTSNSDGSPLTSSEGSPNTPPTSKMYPYVSNHPTTHSSLSGMPGFSGLEDKSCR